MSQNAVTSSPAYANKGHALCASPLSFAVRYSYLLRLIATITLALSLPLFLFFITVNNRVYNDTITETDAANLERATYFAHYFEEQLDGLHDQAFNIGFNGNFSKSKLEMHSWYTIEAINYTIPAYLSIAINAEDLGISYGGTDYIIAHGVKCTTEQYAVKYGGTEELDNELIDFLNHRDGSGTMLYSTYGKKAQTGGRLFIGVSSNTLSSQPSLIFFVLSPDFIRSSVLSSLSVNDNSLFVLDKTGSLLFSSDETYSSVVSSSDFCDFRKTRDRSTLISSDKSRIYRYVDPTSSREYYLVYPNNNITGVYLNLYRNLQNILWLCAAVMLLTLSASILINYLPISKLVRRSHDFTISTCEGTEDASQRAAMPDTHTKGELQTIEETMERIYSENNLNLERSLEQRLITTDALLSNLLDGRVLPERAAKHITGGNPASFRVVVAPNLKLDNLRRERLINELSVVPDMKVFITDIPDENFQIFIFMQHTPSFGSGSFEDAVYKLRGSLKEPQRMGISDPVRSPNDIRAAYREALKRSADDADDDTSPIKSLYPVHYYPSKEIRQFNEWVERGAETEALKLLSDIHAIIQREGYAPAVKRYLCYDLLCSFMNTLRALNLPSADQDENLKEMLVYQSTDELFSCMERSLSAVCEMVQSGKQRKAIVLRDNLLKYVNLNYSDVGICLTQVADYFNISIYTLSRIFKEYTGIGFKEYIISRRIEKARSLLLSTVLPVSQIAIDVGFSNSDVFTKIFKSISGQTPTQYRIDFGME